MSDIETGDTVSLCPCKLRSMPPTHPSQADVAAAYRTLIAHETAPKEQDFYRARLQRLEQATEPECELDCRSRIAAAGVGVYCPQCSAECADTDLATELANAIRAAWVDRLDSGVDVDDELTEPWSRTEFAVMSEVGDRVFEIDWDRGGTEEALDCIVGGRLVTRDVYYGAWRLVDDTPTSSPVVPAPTETEAGLA